MIVILLMAAFSFRPALASIRGIGVRPVSPSGTVIKGDQWLFVIGIDTYINWPRLKTAVNDAKAVKDVLLSRYHFDRKHLIELYDEQATRDNILKSSDFWQGTSGAGFEAMTFAL